MFCRGFLRASALAWCVIQVLALGAVWPRDCCAWHETPHQQAAETRESGEMCPMHGDTDDGRASRTADEPTCVMRGTCGGPTVYTLFTSPGILPDLTVPTPHFLNPPADGPVAEHHGRLLAQPDAPPPRA